LTAGLSIASIPAHAERQPAVQSRNADVNGTKIHYLIAGKGEPILLLHGYAHNSHMGRPLMARYFAPSR
jgi:pimeloyl-ACP methyl ester carboxylesterase